MDEADPDGRVTLVVGRAEQAGPGDRVLHWAGSEPTLSSYAPGCACCRPRDGLATALARLHLSWARDGAPTPRRVVIVTPRAEAAAEIASLLERDVLARARFRVGS